MSAGRVQDLTPSIDLNLDGGESEASLLSGREAELFALVSSVNIACGGHAGDLSSMERAVDLALEHGLAVGAHPSYPDREGFGRRSLTMISSELTASILAQVEALSTVCRRKGARLSHLKPHGALYNDAARGGAIAFALLSAVSVLSEPVALVGLSGSALEEICRKREVEFIGEAFVDRVYERDGTLRERRHPDALILDPRQAAAQAVGIASGRGVVAYDGTVVSVRARTLCLHGDHAASREIARAVRSALFDAGICIESFEPKRGCNS